MLNSAILVGKSSPGPAKMCLLDCSEDVDFHILVADINVAKSGILTDNAHS